MGGYHIDLRLGGLAIQFDASRFQLAANKWQSIITSDVPQAKLPLSSRLGICGLLPSKVDDLLICARYLPIDGPGGVLGSSGPGFLRKSSNIPATGQMIFDVADVGTLRNDHSLEVVLTHEMGHILGIGTVWDVDNLISGSPCDYQNNSYASIAWRNISGCSGPAPVEHGGGQGTACGHWDESCLQAELMTGYLNGVKSVIISTVTIGTLQDIGYKVNYGAADQFSASDLNPSCVCKRRILREGSNGIATSLGGAQRKLSDAGRLAAIKYGKEYLTKMKEEAKNFTDTDEVTFVGDKFVSILYMDGANGIFSVQVRAED